MWVSSLVRVGGYYERNSSGINAGNYNHSIRGSIIPKHLSSNVEARYCKFKGKLAYITRLCLKKEKQIQNIKQKLHISLKAGDLSLCRK